MGAVALRCSKPVRATGALWIYLPIGYGKTMWDPTVNWKFYTEPDANMDNRRIYWPRGRCLGGSFLINGLICHTRPIG